VNLHDQWINAGQMPCPQSGRGAVDRFDKLRAALRFLRMTRAWDLDALEVLL
jgi:hypothetical protein